MHRFVRELILMKETTPRRTVTAHNSHLTQHAHHGMTTSTIHGTCPAYPPFSTTTVPHRGSLDQYSHPSPFALPTTALPIRWHHGCFLPQPTTNSSTHTHTPQHLPNRTITYIPCPSPIRVARQQVIYSSIYYGRRTPCP